MGRKDREPLLEKFIRSCRRGIALDRVLGFEPPVEGITDVLVRDHGVKPEGQYGWQTEWQKGWDLEEEKAVKERNKGHKKSHRSGIFAKSFSHPFISFFEPRPVVLQFPGLTFLARATGFCY